MIPTPRSHVCLKIDFANGGRAISVAASYGGRVKSNMCCIQSSTLQVSLIHMHMWLLSFMDQRALEPRAIRLGLYGWCASGKVWHACAIIPCDHFRFDIHYISIQLQLSQMSFQTPQGEAGGTGATGQVGKLGEVGDGGWLGEVGGGECTVSGLEKRGQMVV